MSPAADDDRRWNHRSGDMSDPRLNGCHLSMARRGRYDAAVDDLLDGRGMATMAADPEARPPVVFRQLLRYQPPGPGGAYTLVSLTDGLRYRLRVGINTIGRAPQNDLII